MSNADGEQPGGFVNPGPSLPSPAPSSASTGSSPNLPHPRSRSLQSGSRKEEMVRRYVEDRLLHISRRYVKKFGDPDVSSDIVGYKTFSEVARDLDTVINVLWLSATPELQIPFLLKLASDLTQYVRSFPPAPKASFEVLGKLDHCFASLLSGQDISSGEPLPGFERGLRAGMSTTDMVRCRSLVEQTRVLMVEVLSGVPEDENDEDGADDESDGNDIDESDGPASSVRDASMAWDIDEDMMHLDAARIYENTIVQLGGRLGDPLGAVNMTED